MQSPGQSRASSTPLYSSISKTPQCLTTCISEIRCNNGSRDRVSYYGTQPEAGGRSSHCWLRQAGRDSPPGALLFPVRVGAWEADGKEGRSPWANPQFESAEMLGGIEQDRI